MHLATSGVVNFYNAGVVTRSRNWNIYVIKKLSKVSNGPNGKKTSRNLVTLVSDRVVLYPPLLLNDLFLENGNERKPML
jgi:hypothetical protein